MTSELVSFPIIQKGSRQRFSRCRVDYASLETGCSNLALAAYNTLVLVSTDFHLAKEGHEIQAPILGAFMNTKVSLTLHTSSVPLVESYNTGGGNATGDDQRYIRRVDTSRPTYCRHRR